MKKNEFITFIMYNSKDGEEVLIHMKKNIINRIIEYPKYFNVCFSTGSSYDGSYKVKKNFNITDILNTD